MTKIKTVTSEVIVTDSNNKFEIEYGKDEGYSLVSRQTGNRYDLLEGKSLGGTCTSDIIFIMKVNPETGYERLVNFTFGANDTDRDGLCYAAKMIDDYEAGIERDLSERFDYQD